MVLNLGLVPLLKGHKINLRGQDMNEAVETNKESPSSLRLFKLNHMRSLEGRSF